MCLAAALIAGRIASAGDPEGAQAWKDVSRLVLGFSGLSGSLRAGSFRYWSFPPVTDLKCRVHIEEDCWRFEDVEGDFCGGKMFADSILGLATEGRTLKLVAEFAEVRLEEFTRLMNITIIPGRLSAKLDLNIGSQGRAGIDGTAEVHVRGADLGRFPLVLKILYFLSLPGLEKEIMEEADAIMTLTPRGIRFQSLAIRSRSGVVSLEADRLGSVTYEGLLDLRFRPVIESRFLKSMPFVGPTADEIVSKLEQGLMRVHVTGTAGEPKFQWRPFR